MPAIIDAVIVPSGISVYAFIRDKAGLVWNGTNFVGFNSANWSTYAVTMTEQVPSSYFSASFPSAILPGKYSYTIHQGSPPTSGDPAVDSGIIDWDGNNANYIGLITAKLPPGTISDFDEMTENVNLNSNQTGVTIGTVNALGTSAQSAVKSQIDTSLGSDAISELVGVPSSTPNLKQAIMLLFMALRNKRTSDATTVKIYNASGAVIATATQSDNSVTYIKNNFS